MASELPKDARPDLKVRGERDPTTIASNARRTGTFDNGRTIMQKIWKKAIGL